MKNVAWKLLPDPFFPRIICKKDSEEVITLIWKNFDSLFITYVSSLFRKFHFPIEVKFIFFLELVLTPQFLYNFLMIFFLL